MLVADIKLRSSSYTSLRYNILDFKVTTRGFMILFYQKIISKKRVREIHVHCHKFK